jgi:hypothetical protein
MFTEKNKLPNIQPEPGLYPFYSAFFYKQLTSLRSLFVSDFRPLPRGYIGSKVPNVQSTRPHFLTGNECTKYTTPLFAGGTNVQSTRLHFWPGEPMYKVHGPTFCQRTNVQSTCLHFLSAKPILNDNDSTFCQRTRY